MCGRFTLRRSAPEIAEAFDLGNMPELAPRYNVAPTQQIFAVRHAREGSEGTLLRWGLVPSWSASLSAGAPLFNARSETAATKPAFRSAFKRRRCLIPADGFYEWKAEGRKKLPHLFTVREGGLFAIAGLWESWERGGERADTACLLTTDANAVVSPVHDRMPVILPPEEWTAWLDPTTDPGTLQSLLLPYPASEMGCRQVSEVVNSARNEGPACVEPAVATLFG